MRFVAIFCVMCVIAGVAGAARGDRSAAVINVTQTQIRHFGDQAQVGDDELWIYQLYNRRITRAAIGYSTLRCEYYGSGGPLGSGVSDCAAIYSLAKGKIIARGLVKSRSYYALAVVGGTGLYAHYGGQVLASTIGSRPHEERLIFDLE